MFARGFTGHEHLDLFNLINMNGRVYDPYLGRFLSPDNIVQSTGNTQSYNRYSYCFNNPLKYVDPSGLFAQWTDWSSYNDFGGRNPYQEYLYMHFIVTPGHDYNYGPPGWHYPFWAGGGYLDPEASFHDWMIATSPSAAQRELYQHFVWWERQKAIIQLDNYFGAGYGERAYNYLSGGGTIESDPGYLVTVSSSGRIGVVMPGISQNNYLAIGQFIVLPPESNPNLMACADCPPGSEGGDNWHPPMSASPSGWGWGTSRDLTVTDFPIDLLIKNWRGYAEETGIIRYNGQKLPFLSQGEAGGMEFSFSLQNFYVLKTLNRFKGIDEFIGGTINLNFSVGMIAFSIFTNYHGPYSAIGQNYLGVKIGLGYGGFFSITTTNTFGLYGY